MVALICIQAPVNLGRATERHDYSLGQTEIRNQDSQSPSLTLGPHQTQFLQHDPVSSHWVSEDEHLLLLKSQMNLANLLSLPPSLPGSHKEQPCSSWGL